MTKAEFLAKIQEVGTGIDWYCKTRLRGVAHLDWSDCPQNLRSEHNYSPITLVCRMVTGNQFGNSQWRDAARAIGMRQNTAEAIERASCVSPLPSRTDRRFRRALFAATKRF